MNPSPFKKLLLAVITVSFFPIFSSSLASTQSTKLISVQKQLANLETTSAGRLGIFAIDTANNKIIQYRADERFPMGCTSKVMGVAAILKKSMQDPHFLRQKVTYKKEELVFWSPITEQHVTDGMTINDLSAAAIMYSDNTAMNLLIKKLGGIATINAYARSIGNDTFKMARGYPEEAASIPGDLRDTTTPTAMGKSLQRLALGDALGLSERKQLQTWLKSNTTGNHRIRAGIPKGWSVGDKTGTGDYGTTNDIAIIWPTKSSPIVMAIYFTQNKKNATKRDDVVATAARILISSFGCNR